MASTPVAFFSPSGLTLDLELYPYGSDTIANGAGGDSATEATNRKGYYTATVTEAITGWHTAHAFDGSNNLIAIGHVYLEDDTDIHIVEEAPIRGYDGRDGFNVAAGAGTAWNSGAITASTIATGAIDADAIADNAIDAGAIAADAITAAKIAAGAIDAATFAADVDAEILSYLVDDATRIDASALNTLSGHDPGEVIMGATDTVVLTDGSLTAAKIAADAITDAKVASDVTIASVTGTVGSVTGNVGGNVTGSVGSLAAQAQADVRTSTGLASANLDTQLAAIAADLPARITKNTALSAFPFFMVLSSDHITGATGKTVTATRSLDGAAFAACANSVTEIANGWYKIDLATTDLNANTVALKFTAADCDARMITLVTQPT